MATYEKRLDAKGRVRAIRVKLRRVGLPHLSRSFPVKGEDTAAVREAEREAERWVEEMASTLAVYSPSARTSGPVDLRTAWRMSQTSDVAARENYRRMRFAITPLGEDLANMLFAHAESPESRALILLVMETGLSFDELDMLRWQWIHLADSTVVVPGPGGISYRTLPLTPKVLDALFAMGGRKYGPVFADVATLETRIRENLNQVGNSELAKTFSLANLRREAARLWLSRGVPPREVADRLNLNDLEAYLDQVGYAPPSGSAPSL